MVVTRSLTDAAIQCLAAGLRGRLLQSGDDGYDAARTV